jgi:MFS family permease
MSHNGDSDNTNNNKINPDNMSIIFMLCSLISSLMGPLFGLIYDKLYFKYTMIIIDVISALNGLLINLTVKWGVYYYAVSIILNGCLNSGAFSMIFPHVSKIYGFNYAGELYGFTVLSTGISSMMSSTVYYIISHFSDKKNDGPYLYIFVIGAVCNILAGIFTFFDSDKNFEFECISNNKEGG